MALISLFNINMAQGNAQVVVNLLPGGVGPAQLSGTPAGPMLTTPTADNFVREFLDTTAPGYFGTPTTAATPTAAISTPQGTVVGLPMYPAVQGCAPASGNTGAAQFIIPQMPAQPLPKFAFGVVDKISDKFSQPGGFATAIAQGPAQLALATAGANAITYGTLLTTDGAGNLTSFNNPTSLSGVTPTATSGGTSGSTAYQYIVIPVSVNGTFGTASTVSTAVSGAATLNGTAFVVVTWATSANPDAAGYIIIRAIPSATGGAIGYVQAPTNVFVDYGQTAAQGTNSTGQFAQRPTSATALAVVSGGTSGAATWQYTVFSIAPNGVWSTSATVASATNGAANLSPANGTAPGAYIKLTWTTASGAALYAVQRTSAGTTPSSVGLIGFATSAQAASGFFDDGLPATTLTAQLVPTPTPQPGACLAVSLGTLAANTTAATQIPVIMGGL